MPHKKTKIFFFLCTFISYLFVKSAIAFPTVAQENLKLKPNKEQILKAGTNWEPTTTADPNKNSPYVYMATTVFDEQLCHDPHNDVCQMNPVIIKTSKDRGKNWGEDVTPCNSVCVEKLFANYPIQKNYHKIDADRDADRHGVSFQYDPSIHACKDKKGTVLLAYLIGFLPGVVVQSSSDHGKTWSEPLPVALSDHLIKTGGSDKPTIIANDSCQDIYVNFSGEDGNYLALSHDKGKTFQEARLISPIVHPEDKYHTWFTPNGTVDSSGNIYFSEMQNNETNSDDVTFAITSSKDKGQTWQTKILGKAFYSTQCEPKAGCSIGYLTPQIVIGSDGKQTAVAFTKPDERNTKKKLFFALNWQTDKDVLNHGILINDNGDSNFPMIVGGLTSCEYQITWMDNRNSKLKDKKISAAPFNMYMKKTTDCGKTWSPEILLSNVHENNIVRYKNKEGFKIPYGDYTGLTINSFGDVFAVWGEGESIKAEGAAWFNMVAGKK